MSNINWDVTYRFDPNDPLNAFATHGIPLPVYGLYGGPNWTAGQIGGTVTPTSPGGVDLLDALFKTHDYMIQNATNQSDVVAAHVQLVYGMQALTYTDPLGQADYDPEAGLYEGFATLGILAQLAAFGFKLPDQGNLVKEAVGNFEAGLAAVPGEAKSLHGAFHVFEHQYLDFLL